MGQRVGFDSPNRFAARSGHRRVPQASEVDVDPGQFGNGTLHAKTAGRFHQEASVPTRRVEDSYPLARPNVADGAFHHVGHQPRWRVPGAQSTPLFSIQRFVV